QALLRGRPETVQNLLVSLGGQPLDPVASPQGLPRVGRLPGTAIEAQAIAPSVKTYARVEPRLYTDKQAVEGVFKAARSPRLVVLSTHGFFLDDKETKPEPASVGVSGQQQAKARGRSGSPAPRSAGPSSPARQPENPLLRCGLMLAGCNESAHTKAGD